MEGYVRSLVQLFESGRKNRNCMVESSRTFLLTSTNMAKAKARDTAGDTTCGVGSKILEPPIPIDHIFSFLDVRAIACVEQTCKSFQKVVKKDGWTVARRRIPHPIPSIIYGLDGGSSRQRDTRKVPTRNNGWTSVPPALPYVLTPKIQVRLYYEAKAAAGVRSFWTASDAGYYQDLSIRAPFPKPSGRYLLYVHLSGRLRRKHSFSGDLYPKTMFEGFFKDQRFGQAGACKLSLPKQEGSWEGLDLFRSRASNEQDKKIIFQSYEFRAGIVAIQISSTRKSWTHELTIATASIGTENNVNHLCCDFHPRSDFDSCHDELQQHNTHSCVIDKRLRSVFLSLHATEDYADLDFVELRVQSTNKGAIDGY